MNKYFTVLFLTIFAVGSHAAIETTKIAKSNGAKQCESGHISLAAMKNELADNGVKVVSAACGNDGMMHPTVCGVDAGEINIFEVSPADLDKAKKLGFKPLSEWPDAQEVPCRDENLSSNKAVEVSIFGMGPPVDAKAYKKVRLVIGNAVTGGILDKFIVRGYGIEGGFSACVEAGRFAPARRFDNFVKQLRAIRADPKTTAYSINPVTSCSFEVG
jgi:hypothetical protein